MTERSRRPLTREELIAVAAQLKKVSADVNLEKNSGFEAKGADSGAEGVGVELAFTNFMNGLIKLQADGTERRVIETYRDAFLIAAGVKEPIVLTPKGKVIKLVVEQPAKE